jgi:hypothetical protein
MQPKENVMKLSLLAVAVFLVAVSSSAQVDPNATAVNTLYEQGPIGTVVTHIADKGFGTPRVLQSGTMVRLYTGGVDDFEPTSTGLPVHDKIFQWENPNTWAGWNSPYSFVGVVVPKGNCTGSSPSACRTDHNYSMNWAWQSNNKVYLLAGTGSVLNEWPEVLLGESTDGGITFNWTDFLKTSNGVHFVKLTWQPITIGTTQYLYGYADFKYHPEERSDGRGDYGIGAIRFKPSTSLSAPFLIDATATMEVWAGATAGGWKPVPRCGSGFTFCLTVDPLIAIPGERFPSLYKMTRYGNALELWTMVDASSQSELTCPICPLETNLRQNAFGYRAVNDPATTSSDPFSLFSTPRRLLKQRVSAPLRCTPGNYSHSRKHPTRLEWTLNLLYSRTFDKPGVLNVCPPDGRVDGSEGWIVVTQLTTIP